MCFYFVRNIIGVEDEYEYGNEFASNAQHNRSSFVSITAFTFPFEPGLSLGSPHLNYRIGLSFSFTVR